MDCNTIQFIGIMVQIFGTIIITTQAIRGQLRIDQSVSMNEKGRIVISNSLALGIISVIGGLFIQAIVLVDVKSTLCS